LAPRWADDSRRGLPGGRDPLGHVPWKVLRAHYGHKGLHFSAWGKTGGAGKKKNPPESRGNFLFLKPTKKLPSPNNSFLSGDGRGKGKASGLLKPAGGDIPRTLENNISPAGRGNQRHLSRNPIGQGGAGRPFRGKYLGGRRGRGRSSFAGTLPGDGLTRTCRASRGNTRSDHFSGEKGNRGGAAKAFPWRFRPALPGWGSHFVGVFDGEDGGRRAGCPIIWKVGPLDQRGASSSFPQGGGSSDYSEGGDGEGGDGAGTGAGPPGPVAAGLIQQRARRFGLLTKGLNARVTLGGLGIGTRFKGGPRQPRGA